MPWKIQKSDTCPKSKPWAVIKEEDGEVVACHPSKEKATEHMRALYVNAASRYLTYPVAFSTKAEDLQKGVWIQAAKFGDFKHPVYGTVIIDNEFASRMKRNFDSKVYQQDIPVTFEHFGMDSAKGFKAAGWVKQVDIRNDGIFWFVEFTEEAAKEIDGGAWRYFSPEWVDEWTDPETSTSYADVAVGGAITNNPFFKGMAPLNFSEWTAKMVPTTTGSAVSNNVAYYTTTTDSTSTHPWWTLSVADWEHSEPGEGTVVPLEDKDVEEPGQGTRSPSNPTPDPESNGGTNVFRELLIEKLGLSENATDEEVTAAVEGIVAEVTPIREAAEAADATKTFSEQFPEQSERLQRLERREREFDAKSFSERYANSRVKETVGEGDGAKLIDTRYGFSAVTVEKIRDAHLAFSTGELNEAHISEVLDSILNNGLVEYGERGTSVDSTPAPTETKEAPKVFSKLVQDIMEKDNLDTAAATKLAAKQNPELFAAYRQAVAR